jgi:hypothetical protein
MMVSIDISIFALVFLVFLPLHENGHEVSRRLRQLAEQKKREQGVGALAPVGRGDTITLQM